jgi:hypothetical protein
MADSPAVIVLGEPAATVKSAAGAAHAPNTARNAPKAFQVNCFIVQFLLYDKFTTRTVKITQEKNANLAQPNFSAAPFSAIIARVETVLIFVPFSRYIFKQMIGGVAKFFAGRRKVQVIEACANASHLRSLLNFWQPVGCIVEASEGVGFFTPKRFGDIPVVYLDPAKAADWMFAVMQDYAAAAHGSAPPALSLQQPDFHRFAKRHERP